MSKNTVQDINDFIINVNILYNTVRAFEYVLKKLAANKIHLENGIFSQREQAMSQLFSMSKKARKLLTKHKNIGITCEQKSKLLEIAKASD